MHQLLVYKLQIIHTKCKSFYVHVALYLFRWVNLFLTMLFRSELSLEKDEFNYAFMLAHDLQKYPSSEWIKLTPQQRFSILSISFRLTNKGIASLEDLAEIESLLGTQKTNCLKQNAIFKARLETDLVNG